MPIKTVDIPIDKLIPYDKNAKVHDEKQIYQIANSLLRFGWKQPVVIDKDNVIIVGHGRVEGAKIARKQNPEFDKAPCVIADDLSEDEIKAYRLADNKLNESPWDVDLVNEELTGITELDMSMFAFDLKKFDDGSDFFSRENRSDDSREEGNEEYNEFLEKFEAKKTTDDCYTPDLIYNAVADWVSSEYGVNRENFVRPFYPGGDYQKFKYEKDSIVVDNPPFSILAEIMRWYADNGIRFFLFGPTLTLFSSSSSVNSCTIPVGASVTYENGAKVNTSFATNLEDESLRTRTAPELYKAVTKADEETQKQFKKELPKYSYPDNIITAAMVARWSKYGIEFKVSKAESEPIDALDEQKEQGKTIYGKGYLLSERAAAERAAAERAAAERAAAERWTLSEREKEIVARLSK